MRSDLSIRLFLLTASLLGLGACAGAVNKVDRDSLASVRSMAIVGFTYDQQLANSGSTLLDQALGKNDTAGFGKIIEKIEAKPHVEEAYRRLKQSLAKKGWSMAELPRLTENPELKALYEKKNATIQTGVTPLPPHFYRYEVAGIPQFYTLQFADHERLNSLAKNLGVDALAIAFAKTRLSQTSVLGIGVGKIGSVTDLALLVYDPRRSDFTVVMNATGDESETKGNQLGGFADADAMNIQALESYESALEKAVGSI